MRDISFIFALCSFICTLFWDPSSLCSVGMNIAGSTSILLLIIKLLISPFLYIWDKSRIFTSGSRAALLCEPKGLCWSTLLWEGKSSSVANNALALSSQATLFSRCRFEKHWSKLHVSRSFVTISAVTAKIDCTRFDKYWSKLHISRSFVAISAVNREDRLHSLWKTLK